MKEVEDVAADFGVDIHVGLSADEVARRQERYGFNELEKEPGECVAGCRSVGAVRPVMLLRLRLFAVMSLCIGSASGIGLARVVCNGLRCTPERGWCAVLVSKLFSTQPHTTALCRRRAHPRRQAHVEAGAGAVWRHAGQGG